MRRAPRAPARALREFQASGPDRTAGVGEMNTPGRALSQKALVGITPAFGSSGLVSSPRCRRAVGAGAVVVSAGASRSARLFFLANRTMALACAPACRRASSPPSPDFCLRPDADARSAPARSRFRERVAPGRLALLRDSSSFGGESERSREPDVLLHPPQCQPSGAEARIASRELWAAGTGSGLLPVLLSRGFVRGGRGRGIPCACRGAG